MATMNDATSMPYNAVRDASVRLYKGGIKAVLVFGPPGCGKTAMAREIPGLLGYKHYFQIKLSHHDVPDVAGVPVARDDTRRTHFYPSADMLPPDDLTGGLVVCLDEAGDLNIAQQNLACQMVFEGGIHTYKFPPNTVFFLTSNRVEDRSGAGRIVTKLANRLASMTLVPTTDELIMYGATNGWNPMTLAFLKMHGDERINPSDNRANAPTFFNSFDPTDPVQMAKPQFSSCRSLEFLSDHMNYIDANMPNISSGELIGDTAAIVGTPVASKFVAFREIATTMPNPYDILAGKKVPYPKKEEILWALAITLTSKATKTNVKHLHAFLDQGPDEYLALATRILFDTKAALLAGDDFHKLISSPKLKAMF